MQIFRAAFDSLNNALDIMAAKHSVIASNIANIDTPGFKAKELDFAEAFKGAVAQGGSGMKTTDERHFQGLSVKGSPVSFVRQQVNNSLRNDGNNVNIDKEMLALSQNSIMYDILAQTISRRFDALKYAISEGRRA